MNPLCAACGKEIEGKVLNHHLSYFPEQIVKVDRSCHQLIHQSDKFASLRPDDYESVKFYGPHFSNMTRINISITNEKTIERLQKLSEKMEVSYATLVAIMSQEYEKKDKKVQEG